MLTMLKVFLTSGSFRRAATGISTSIATLAVPYLNAKLGLNMSDAVVSAAIAGLVTNAGVYIAQSMSNEKHAREAAATAVEAVAGKDPAADLARNPTP